MRYIIKILLFPITPIFSLFIIILKLLLGLGTKILFLILLITFLGAIGEFLIAKEYVFGLWVLLIAFLLSQYGIPLVGATILGVLEIIRDRIKEI